jgi:hypothetical protein
MLLFAVDFVIVVIDVVPYDSIRGCRGCQVVHFALPMPLDILVTWENVLLLSGTGLLQGTKR